MSVSEKTYQQVALEDPEGNWELHCGALRSKPGMAAEHNDLMFELGHQLRLQLDRRAFRVRVNAGRVQRSVSQYYVPDVMVIPAAVEQRERGGPGHLEAYTEPLPLVVEVWSPSTGEYDVDAKLPEYQQPGDLEIWRLHPYEQTLTRWVRRPDGSYAESVLRDGEVSAAVLPGVTIDLDALFAA